MRKRIVRWGLGILAVLVLVVAAVSAVYAVSSWRMGRAYSFRPPEVAVPTDPAAIAEGARLAITRGCVDCHGEDLGGRVFVDDPLVGTFAGANLTRGRSGVGGRRSTADFVRAIRHGISSDDTPLVFMPSYEFNPLSDEDLGKLIAYVRQVPAVDREVPKPAPGPLARVFYLTGAWPLIAAERIEHEARRPEAVAPGETVTYGRYLAQACVGCHGPGYSGGAIPGGAPDWPPARNITPHASGLLDWTEADFTRALREGVRPDGAKLSPVMPFAYLAKLTDGELRALWMYLRTLEPRPAGQR